MTEKKRSGWSNEAKVGLLLFSTLLLGGGFAWFLGMKNPFVRSYTFYVTYNFAGGIELGSPVRVSGIKVGKVEGIDFFEPIADHSVSTQEPGGAEATSEMALAPVRLKVSVLKEATKGIKSDSKFYINLAGIIGERYLEITPGSQAAPSIESGATVAGIDPPRIDQLLSQSFDLAGKIADLVEKNKGEISKTIELLVKLSSNLNGLLTSVDKSHIFKSDIGNLVENLNAISKDVRVVTSAVQTDEGKKTLKLIHELLWRLEPVKEQSVRDFLQKDGIKAHIRVF